MDTENNKINHAIITNFLKNNLTIQIKKDRKICTNECIYFDVIVELNGEEISKADFDVDFSEFE